MKETGMLFNGAMVRALLDGRKTQTRRIAKPQPFDRSYSKHDHHMEYTRGRASNGDEIDGLYAYSTSSGGNWIAKSPYGQPGDRIWVRETWMPDPDNDGTWAYTQFMGCKGSPLSDIPTKFRKPKHCIYRASWGGDELVGWKPSLHMPRWASRITLEITDVRIERLHDISEADAIAEGVTPYHVRQINLFGASKMQRDQMYRNSVMEPFKELWESTGGDWNANPWVWVYEFKQIKTGAAT